MTTCPHTAVFTYVAAASIAFTAGRANAQLARETESRRPTVVARLPSGAGALDAPRLRAAISSELRADVVEPTDPRAETARGTLDVSVDRLTQKIVVTYRARTAVVSRDEALPVDDAATANAIVRLAGNLARDEASELAGELRSSRSGDEARVADDEARDLARLRATLAYYGDQDAKARRTLGWGSIATGTATAGTGIYIGLKVDTFTGVVVGSVGGLFVLGGSLLFAQKSDLERLATFSAKGVGADRLMEEWTLLAGRERMVRNRRVVIGFVAAGLEFSAAALDLVGAPQRHSSGVTVGHWNRDDVLQTEFAGAMILLGAAQCLLAVDALTREGPVERALHGYQSTNGPSATAASAVANLASAIRVSPIANGATAGLAGTF